MARPRTVGPWPRMEVDRPFRSIFGRLVATRFPQSVFGRRHDLRAASIVQAEPDLLDIGALCETPQAFGIGAGEAIDGLLDKIGRASRRERVCQYVKNSVGAVTLTKK